MRYQGLAVVFIIIIIIIIIVIIIFMSISLSIFLPICLFAGLSITFFCYKSSFLVKGYAFSCNDYLYQSTLLSFSSSLSPSSHHSLSRNKNIKRLFNISQVANLLKGLKCLNSLVDVCLDNFFAS